MKKVIVFLAVMAIAGAANAASVRIEVNGGAWDGQSSVAPSDIITFIFSEDVAVFGGFGDFLMGVSEGHYEADTLGFHEGPWVLAPSTVDAVQPVNGGFTVFAASQGFPAPTGDIMWFDFHVPELPDSSIIDITHLQGNWNNLFPDNLFAPIRLHVTPEPMTIGLLGLGGLALLRRRRK
jgi:hypothetical protein